MIYTVAEILLINSNLSAELNKIYFVNNSRYYIGLSNGGVDVFIPSSIVDKETPSGAINGQNVTYTLANIPIIGSEYVYLNGILQESGSGNDYTISESTITFLSALLVGEKIMVTYRK